jgi:hypothetical protein
MHCSQLDPLVPGLQTHSPGDWKIASAQTFALQPASIRIISAVSEIAKIIFCTANIVLNWSTISEKLVYGLCKSGCLPRSRFHLGFNWNFRTTRKCSVFSFLNFSDKRPNNFHFTFELCRPAVLDLEIYASCKVINIQKFEVLLRSSRKLNLLFKSVF